MRNPDTSLPNRNSLYLACSGGGKSQALFQNPAIPRSKVRCLLWDPDEDHPARRFYSLSKLKAALAGELKRGRGFRLAYSGDADVKAFELWCGMVNAILDGNVPTYVVIEELADVSETAGKASPNFGTLLRRGRKYGAQLHITTQRGTEISKTAYTQCPLKWIGQQEGADVERMAKLCSIEPERIKQLNPLEYWFKKAGAGEPERVKLDYKPIPR